MHIRRAASAAMPALALACLTACGSADAESAATPEPTNASTSAAPSATPSEAAATTPGGQPAWAKPLTEPGTKIASVTAGDVTVDVFQVGVAKATSSGQFVDPDKNEPIIAEGDDIVFVNYVVTNTGAPLDLGFSLVGVDARYVDWPYLQGMDGIVDNDLFAAQEVNTFGLAPGTLNDEGVYTLGAGESFSYGDNFHYQKGTEVEFTVTYTPVDASGDLQTDRTTEGRGTGTIS